MSRTLNSKLAFALVLISLLLFGQAMAQDPIDPNLPMRDWHPAHNILKDNSGGDHPGNHPPNGFPRLLPEDGITLPRNNVLFQWRFSGDPDGDPVHFYLQWNINDVPYQSIYLTDTSYVMDFTSLDLPAGQLHVVWHVWACDCFHSTVEAYNGPGSFYLDAVSGMENPEVNRVSDYRLANYPNPFNPTTTLSFNLPQSGDVNLAVFDLAGRLVWEYRPGTLAAGEHRVAFDGSNLPSGTYLTRLSAGNMQLSRKIMLVK